MMKQYLSMDILNGKLHKIKGNQVLSVYSYVSFVRNKPDDLSYIEEL